MFVADGAVWALDSSGALDLSLFLVVELWSPVAKIVFGIVQDLAGLCSVRVVRTGVTWYDRGVVQELDEATSVAGENDLLLGTLDGSQKFGIVCFLELLASLSR